MSNVVRRYPDESPINAGVCAGFAYAFGYPLWMIRMLLAMVVLFGAGTPVLIYLLMWCFVPSEQAPDDFDSRTA